MSMASALLLMLAGAVIGVFIGFGVLAVAFAKSFKINL